MEIISRADAKAQGLTRYFTGKPCKHGHVSERIIAGQCCECRKVYHEMMYGGKRPNEGTNGREIWDALDELAAKGESPTRKQVLQLANERGWNDGNAVTEINYWRKFHGLSKSRAAA